MQIVRRLLSASAESVAPDDNDEVRSVQAN